MNRSSKGFGLTSVVVVVLFMIVTAAFSTSAQSTELSIEAEHITSE